VRSPCAAIAAVIALVLGTSACSSGGLPLAESPPLTTGPSPAATREVPAGPTGTLRVTQVQTACCYTEGQVSYLSITGPGGPVIADRSFRPLANRAVLYSVLLAAATYEVVSYQRPCDGNCDNLDGPTDRCWGLFDLAPGALIAVVVRFAPGKGCTMSIDPTVESLIPDEIALVGERHDCGLDNPSPPHPARQCFADAYNAGVAAQVTTYASPNYGQVVRFDNGIITVYQQVLGPKSNPSPWTVQTCAGLKPDKTNGYKLEDCSPFRPLT
jgi:hypothetical protein